MLKKAQISGGKAAALIAIVALIIILYIALLPEEQRQELLYGENYSVNETVEKGEEVLLLSHPGSLEYLEKDKIEHTIPALSLYTQTEGVIFKKIDSVHVSRWLLGGKSQEINFSIGDLKNTDNVILGYSVEEGDGRLIITLNGKEILNKEVRTAQPLELSKEYLKEGSNVLKFSASRPGLLGSNSYTIENVQVTGDVTDVSGQTASAVFLVSASEKSHMDYVRLKFVPYCEIGDVGKLSVDINGNNIFSGKPDYCDSPLPAIEFSPSNIYSDENTLTFSTTEGNYVIDNIRVESHLREYVNPVYYFNLNKEQLDDAQDKTRDLVLKIKFSDNIAYKAAKIIVNSKTLYIDGKDQTYEFDINDYVIKGNNAITIEPSITLDIVDLSVKFE